MEFSHSPLPLPLAVPLPFTGERFTPECSGEIAYEHWHRYRLLESIVSGKVILDAACGEGYGSALLARWAESVTGVDQDPKAIQHAQSRYQTIAHLQFSCASCTSLPFPDRIFDCIVSFETLEHLAEQEIMLAEFQRVLKPTGVLILSSPNRPVYSQEIGTRNEFHVKELNREELKTLAQRYFPQITWYAQRILLSSVIWSESQNSCTFLDDRMDQQLRTSYRFFSPNQQLTTPPTEPAPPMYYMILCTAAHLEPPPLPALSLFSEPEQNTLKQYQTAVARAADAEHLVGVTYLREQEKIARLTQELDETKRLLTTLEATAQMNAATPLNWQTWFSFPLNCLRQMLRL